MKPLDLSQEAPWKQRFRAASIMWAQTAKNNPAQGIVCTVENGLYQLHSWEIETGRLTPLTDSETGTFFGAIASDGSHLYYLKDQTGNELGHMVRQAVTGGEAEDLTPDWPPYASLSFDESHNGALLGFMAAGAGGFQANVIEKEADGRLGSPRLLWQSAALSFGPLLSYDGETAVIATTEQSGKNEYSLIALNTRTGDKLAEFAVANANISAACFAPRAGDNRVLGTSNESGYARPLIWDPLTNAKTMIPLPHIEGEIQAWDWADDKLLFSCLNKAEFQLYIYNLASEQLFSLDRHPGGTIGGFFGGQFTPEGDVLVDWTDATRPRCLIVLDGQTGEIKETVLTAAEVPASRPWQSISFATVDGTEIQGWLGLPEGNGPFPTILHMHGGPTAVMTEMFAPGSQSWLDHGFAFLSINYRGSITFGKAFEEVIWGNLGHAELEDMAAAQTWLVSNGIAMPDSILLAGGSYGGYLTLFGLGRRPDLWAGGMADVAVADWHLMYEDQSEILRGYQRALFQGTPEEKGEAYTASSPITYAADVAAPLLVIQGKNDSRCPSRQFEAYAHKMAALGKDIQVEWFDAGHISMSIEEQIRHQELRLRFAYRVLG